MAFYRCIHTLLAWNPPCTSSVVIGLRVSQIVETDITTTDALDLAMDDDDNHGKCSVVFVGIVLSDDQKLELQDYSRKFKVGQHQRAR